MAKNILIIGAGAVGMVYGKYLADGGNSVTFYVREKYVSSLTNGETLYHLNNDKKLKNPIVFKDFSLVTSFEEVAKLEWDQVYLCISSTALQSFDFLSLKNSLIKESIIVMLQPSFEDYETLLETFPEEQLVVGMIVLISYSTPLATETVEQKGIAYYLPPLMPTPFSGNPSQRDEVIAAFKSGGLSAKSVKSAPNDSLFPTAFLMTFLTALESEDWKFSRLKSNKKLLQQLKLTTNEIFSVLEKKHGIKRPLPFRFISGSRMVKFMLSMAPKVMPMDIETYFEYHFTKVNDQTKLYMSNYLSLAKEINLPAENLERFNKLN